MRNAYSVGQVNRYIKNMFTQDYLLQKIYVKGEVSNCKYHTSGHIYFSLKDETGTLNCVMFARHRRGLAFAMKNGDKVIVGGSVDVYERDGRYYLFFSANWRHNPNGDLETFRIGVAVADSPSGPFSDLYDRPVFDPGYPVIDANVLWDDDGRVYLYYSRCCYKHPVESELSAWARDKGLFDEIEESWVYGVEMKLDFSGVIGEPVALLTPPQSASDPQTGWESRSVTAGEVNRRWTEGSYAFKENGTYYMMYSANFYGGQHYAVGYATAGSPLGPFVKSSDNPVLEKNADKGGEVTGTGHNMVLKLPGGGMYCVYHGRTAPTGDVRMVFIDPMEVTEDGRLKVFGPTTSPQPVPVWTKGL